MARKVSETLNVWPEGGWAPAALFLQFAAVAMNTGGGNLTIQLRKATSAGGANAANHGDAVVVAPGSPAPARLRAFADVRSDELGKTTGGDPFTYVGFTATGETTGNAMLIGMDPRFSNDAIGGNAGDEV